MESKNVIFAWIMLFALLFAVNSVSAEQAFHRKPVVCGSLESLKEKLAEHDMYPLLGAPGRAIAEIQPNISYLDIIIYVFVNDYGKLMVVEQLYSVEGKPMCQVHLGEGIEYDVETLKGFLDME